MSERVRQRLVLSALLVIAAVTFLIGINWGLPTRAVDPFLFGNQPVWPGAKIAQLAGDRTPSASLGADVDRNPIARTGAPVVLNLTDQQRAEIIRRYRLYTYQPDEMITMMALASMRPSIRDFDPKLYQYGGLWVYPVGALIKAFARPQPDQVYYLDHPDAFARFYVIARLYTVAWAVLGAWAVFCIARRLSNGDLLTASFATLCYTFMPVVVNMAHEAKPHLPAAVLILLAIIAATKFIENGKKRWWILTGVLCGAAAGMVLSAAVALIVPVTMLLLRRESWNQRLVILLATLVIAVDVYFLTNPYVLNHLIRDRAVLASNLQNSQAMYRASPSLEGAWNALKLIGVGASSLLAVAGAFSLIGYGLALSRKRRRGAPLGWMMFAVSAVVVLQFTLLATDKPAEYARFALLPDIALGTIGVVGAARIARSNGTRITLMVILFTATAFHGVSYVWHFGRDSVTRTTRLIAAERLRTLGAQGATTLALSAEPAPYSLPPVDLFKWKLILLPAGQVDSPAADVFVRTVDWTEPKPGAEYWTRPRVAPTPISWAAKPYEVRMRPSR
jgi:hypothetical protein